MKVGHIGGEECRLRTGRRRFPAETTKLPGWLRAAISHARSAGTRSSTSHSASTAGMPPGGLVRRAAACRVSSRMQSMGSRLPDAAYSPKLTPRTWFGVIPMADRVSSRASSSMTIVGWLSQVSTRR